MTQESAAQLEREAEAARSRMVETASALQNKLSPGQLVDELGSYFKNSDGSMALENLKTQVRDNPLPLALIGTGLAWLFMGGGPSTSRFTGHDAENGSAQAASSGEVWRHASGLPQRGTSAGYSGQSQTSMKDKASAAAGAASRAAGSVTGKMSSAYASAEGGAANAAHRLADSGQQASRAAMHAGTRAQKMFSDTLDREPLILGAIGVAIGAAIGAMLPRTRLEEEYVQPYEERMRKDLADTVKESLDSAKDAASQAYRAGKEEVDRQKSTEANTSEENRAASGSMRTSAWTSETTRPAPESPKTAQESAKPNTTPGKDIL